MPGQEQLVVEMVPEGRLVSPEWNPRYMPEPEMAALMRSLQQFGFVQPLIVNRRTMDVLGGNQRLAAARRLGIAAVPVIYVELDDAKAKALNIGLNRISGDFNTELLIALLREIETQDPAALGVTGLQVSELADLLARQDFSDIPGLAPPEEPEEEAPAEPRAKAQQKQGNDRSPQAIANYYTLKWGDTAERMPPQTYERFIAMLQQWRRTHPGQPGCEDFLGAMMAAFDAAGAEPPDAAPASE